MLLRLQPGKRSADDTATGFLELEACFGGAGSGSCLSGLSADSSNNKKCFPCVLSAGGTCMCMFKPPRPPPRQRACARLRIFDYRRFT